MVEKKLQKLPVQSRAAQVLAAQIQAAQVRATLAVQPLVLNPHPFLALLDKYLFLEPDALTHEYKKLCQISKIPA